MPSAKSDQSPWTTVSWHPLASSLDTRSRPADLAPGAWRYKLNFAVSPDGKLCRRTGFEKWTPSASSYTNFDYHRQGRTRSPVTFQLESTDNTGFRRYYLGTKNSLSTLNFSTGLYPDIASGIGGDGCVWKAAELQNTVIFTNNKDNILALPSGSTTPHTITDLIGPGKLGVSAAKVVVQFSGFILLMNVVQDGERKMTRIIWSDLNLPESFDPAATTTQTVPQFNPDGTPAPPISEVIASIAGFQDLDYGDEILAAAPLQGQLCILTRRAIWVVGVAPTTDNVFTFNRVYYEPVNQTGCLAYENTLVSTGTELWYLGADGIYNYNLYIPTPERQDWLYRASGLIFRKLDTQLDNRYCQSPVSWYLPEMRELWVSWPSIGAPTPGVNDWSFVAQIEQKTADYVDQGFTSFCSFRMSQGNQGGSPQTCYDAEFFLGASGTDWCLKEIGTAFKREYATLDASGDVTVDLPATASYVDQGYTSILRGIIPLGFPDREKIIRLVSVDHDTAWQADPKCYLHLRLGNNHTLVDPNDAEDVCAPQWKIILPDKVLQCPDQQKLSEMTAKNLRPAIGTEWPCLVQGRFLFVELSITNPPVNQGGIMVYPPAIGADSCLQRIDFQALALPLR